MEIDKNKRYRVIFFDWNKTLSNSLFWEQLENPEHERHDWSNNISTYLFRDNKDLVNDWMRGLMSDRDVVEKIASHFNYSPEILLEDLAKSCRNMRLVSDEILHLVQKLRENGTICVIATDNMDTFMKYTVPALRLGKYFDDFLVSFDNKMLKFDVENNTIPFFDGYLKKNNLTYEDVLLIDDCVDTSGVYDRLKFSIFQVFTSNDLVEKLRQLV